ncbi:MAG: DUF3373 domain-containing protein [bacterium]|nr:DUF3373 domain-containing protein [bacterium]
MKKTLIALLSLLVLISLATGAMAKTTEEKVKDLRKKVQKLEVNDRKDAIQWGGDLRVEAHSITGETADYFDGMALQNVMVNSIFFNQYTNNYNAMNGYNPGDSGYMQTLPMNPDGSFAYDQVQGLIGQDPGAYWLWSSNLNFSDLPGGMQGMMMEMGQAMFMMQGNDPADWPAFTQSPDFAAYMGQVQTGAMEMMNGVNGLVPSYKTNNDILYTTRLRLSMDAKVADNVSFTGRLSMYKPWGASTQVGVFNGQANTMAMDANSPGVPGGETLKVERAYFSWKNIGGAPMYLSLGRRPSTGGPPLHYRHDEMRAGTPMGTVIDFQFDGATFGYNFGEYTTVRACYGLGYESQYGNGSMQADQLKDASFFGFNIDAYNTEKMQIQTTIARAFNVTDGFNGYVIMPNDPVSGNPMPGPIVTRFTPSANLGEIDLASVLVARNDGPIDWFVSGSWSKTKPVEGVDTPFGSLMADPFQTAEEQTGSMYYLGARFNLPNKKTKLGLEWNKGSQYWFNFAPAQDDIIAPKTSTRGTVLEGYVTHRVSKNFVVKLGYINYNYDYSGSGWHLGAPKDLDDNPTLGFPTYSKAGKISLGFSARF